MKSMKTKLITNNLITITDGFRVAVTTEDCLCPW